MQERNGNTAIDLFRRPTKIWNPVKLKMMRGEKMTGGTIFGSDRSVDLLRHRECRLRFHLDRDAARAARLGNRRPDVAACPHAKAVPGVRVAYADEREIQHAMDAGALVIVIPTVRTVEEGKAGRDWTYFPPLGKRSQGGGQAFGGIYGATFPAAIATPSTTTSC